MSYASNPTKTNISFTYKYNSNQIVKNQSSRIRTKCQQPNCLCALAAIILANAGWGRGQALKNGCLTQIRAQKISERVKTKDTWRTF